jgi:hypothetical protein
MVIKIMSRGWGKYSFTLPGRAAGNIECRAIMTTIVWSAGY